MSSERISRGRRGPHLLIGEGMEELKEHKVYSLTLAGVTVGCSFMFPDTFSFFGRYITGCGWGNGIRLSPEDRASWEKNIGPMNALSEYSAFTAPISDVLMGFDRCIIHAAAFRFRDKAFLIAAPSGVGKTTQVKTLSELYPGEFSVISGDRPVLEFADDGEVIAHPSPWNGKEGWCGAEAAPLAAIILLKRGDQSSVGKVSAKDAAVRIFTSVFQSADDEECVKRTAYYSDRLLKAAPVWEFVNGGVPDSSRMLYEKVLKEAELYGV